MPIPKYSSPATGASSIFMLRKTDRISESWNCGWVAAERYVISLVLFALQRALMVVNGRFPLLLRCVDVDWI